MDISAEWYKKLTDGSKYDEVLHRLLMNWKEIFDCPVRMFVKVNGINGPIVSVELITTEIRHEETPCDEVMHERVGCIVKTPYGARSVIYSDRIEVYYKLPELNYEI